MKLIYALILFVVLSATTLADGAAPPINEVPGLTLPAAQTVNYDEGFVTVKADCKGAVKWLVLSSNAKLKFKINPASPNEVDIAIPPYDGSITVFCIGIVDGKQTDFARTDITITGAPDQPVVNPATKAAVQKALHLTIIEDPAKRTQTIANMTSADFFKQLSSKGIKPRVYTINDSAKLKAAGFDALLTKYRAPIVILQDDSGKALVIGALPADTAGLLKLIHPYVGNPE